MHSPAVTPNPIVRGEAQHQNARPAKWAGAFSTVRAQHFAVGPASTRTLGRANHILSTSNTAEIPMTATCACGNASITLNAPPTMHGVCHCTNCKRRTGSAFGISAYFDKAAVVACQGETMIYAFHHEAQNHDQERHFCARCGTTLFWFLSVLPDKIGVAGGCFGEEASPDPNMSVSHRMKKPWVVLPGEWSVHA